MTGQEQQRIQSQQGPPGVQAISSLYQWIISGIREGKLTESVLSMFRKKTAIKDGAHKSKM